MASSMSLRHIFEKPFAVEELLHKVDEILVETLIR